MRAYEGRLYGESRRQIIKTIGGSGFVLSKFNSREYKEMGRMLI